ncbi:hypothetical protein F5B22DRAFT_659153 [Xylaria bambusicola]|uniref:uncharacterized protein n=1 Tax=Xylaria bambusicola TaxID=326684 RepID=UPI0020084158|nr:uncharacterized protein F5B22DRAFT_659153 [Xylaria bambusicola]KAI0508569.1 hypothetical protein F5B22DRAFT_659153 [Xylaria bambusicola]
MNCLWHSVTTALESALPSGRCVYPFQPNFDDVHLATYASALDAELRPKFHVLPQTRDEVTIFIKTIRNYVIKNNVKFAVVSGGCLTARGCSSIEQGIVLNLSQLKGIRILSEDIVEIFVGEKWGDVYALLKSIGKMCVGADDAGMGIGNGMSLDRGLSFISPGEGVMCNNVKSCDVVLASGEVIHTSDNATPALFQALRGTGNNVGIVTSIRVRMFDHSQRIYGRTVKYDYLGFVAQIPMLVSAMQSPDGLKGADVSMRFVVSRTSGLFGINYLKYDRQTEEKTPPQVLEPFIPISSECKLGPADLSDLIKGPNRTPGKRLAHMHTCVRPDNTILVEGVDTFIIRTMDLAWCEGHIFSYCLYPYYPSHLRNINTRRDQFSMGTEPFIMIVFRLEWENRDDDNNILAEFQDVLEHIEHYANCRDVAVRFKNMSYSAHFQNPIASYSKYKRDCMKWSCSFRDPDDIFHWGVPGPWKL